MNNEVLMASHVFVVIEQFVLLLHNIHALINLIAGINVY